jgi:universal stress protein E
METLMNTQENRILAVIDPTREDQWALQKAISIAKNRNNPGIIAFLSAYSTAKCDEPDRLRSVVLRRHALWLDEVLEGFANTGIPIEPVVEWNADWRDAICIAAEKANADIVVKRGSGSTTSLANSDRRLIRSLESSALFLVKHDPVEEMKKVLVAIDFNVEDDAHKDLNESIIALGKRIRESSDDIQLHSVSAHDKAEGFKHPPDVAKILDITRAQAHVRRGNAAEVIPDTANKIDADLVIVGNIGRRGVSGVTIGNTAEKILVDIEADVLVLMREAESQRSAA